MKYYIILTILLILGLAHIRIQVYAQVDYGDAPDPPYPTLQANNGASHIIQPIITLGNLIDGEPDGIPIILAYGDDNNGTDDENGVTFSNWLIPGMTYQIIINASSPGFLNAWIDFLADGDWNDAGEQIFVNQTVTAGNNILSFSVPATASSNQYTYGRFRLSNAPGLSYTGLSVDGEVEDYCVYLGIPSTSDIIVKPDPGISFCENEISLTLMPAQGKLVAAYNNHPFPNGNCIGVSISSDNGQTWASRVLTMPTNAISGIAMLDAFDPTVSGNDSGHIFVAHIATDYNWNSGPVSGLYVHKSTDGGTTWKTPVTVDIKNSAVSNPDPNYRFNDRCQIRCDRHTASPYHNNIYLAWIQDRGWNMPVPSSDIYFSSSSNGGKIFSSALRVNELANNMGNMPVHDVAPNGTIYMVWINYNVQTGGNGVLFLDKSTDGGATWGTDIAIDTIILPPINLNNGSDVRAKGAAVIRTHPSNSNKLYLVYAERNNVSLNDESDISFRTSVDGGNTWSQPIKLNDDNTTSDQVMPWMEVKPNGTIDIAWYDRRNSPADMLWDVYFTSSTDEGQTFSANVSINSNMFSSPQTPVGSWFGEYLGLASDNQRAYVAFTSSIIDPKGDIFLTPIIILLLSMTKTKKKLISEFIQTPHRIFSICNAMSSSPELSLH